MIKRLTIHGFRTLRNVDVVLGPATVFVGRSGTGKSSLLATLRILQAVAAGYLDDARAELRSPARNGDGAHEPFEVTVEFSDESERILRYTLDLQAAPDGQFSVEHETLSDGAQVIFESAGRAAMQSEESAPLRSLRGLLANGLRVYDIRAYAVLNNREQSWGNHVAPSGANLASALRDIVRADGGNEAMLSITAALREVVPTVSSLDVVDTDGEPYVVVTHDNTSRSFVQRLDVENEGLIRFLAILTTLYQRPAPTILAFEEPEKGIHPGSLCVLADSLRAWVEEDATRQLIVTTHSPELLNHFTPDELRVVEMLHGRTRIGRLSREQRESVEEQLYRMSDLLTTDLARAEVSDDGGD